MRRVGSPQPPAACAREERSPGGHAGPRFDYWVPTRVSFHPVSNLRMGGRKGAVLLLSQEAEMDEIETSRKPVPADALECIEWLRKRLAEMLDLVEHHTMRGWPSPIHEPFAREDAARDAFDFVAAHGRVGRLRPGLCRAPELTSRAQALIDLRPDILRLAAESLDPLDWLDQLEDWLVDAPRNVPATHERMSRILLSSLDGMWVVWALASRVATHSVLDELERCDAALATSTSAFLAARRWLGPMVAALDPELSARDPLMARSTRGLIVVARAIDWGA